MATSMYCALREAVSAARQEFGRGSGYFRLDAPCTPREIALAIGAGPGQMLGLGDLDTRTFQPNESRL